MDLSKRAIALVRGTGATGALYPTTLYGHFEREMEYRVSRLEVIRRLHKQGRGYFVGRVVVSFGGEFFTASASMNL